MGTCRWRSILSHMMFATIDFLVHTRFRASSVLLAAAVGVMISPGCVSAEPREDLPFADPPAFSQADGIPASQRWWENFADPDLSPLIESALADNFSLTAVYERIHEARAIAGIQASALSPSLDATAGLSVSDGGEQDAQGSIALGLEATYEIDLWKRIQSSVRIEQLEAFATEADYQAAAVMLSASIASALYGHAEATLQLALLDSQLQTNRDVLEVIEERFAIGQSGSADVLRQRQLVEATMEQQVTTRASIDLFEHQIHALLGIPPQLDMSMRVPAQLPQLPPLPDVGLPAELLRRRPDVRAAYLRLESADAAVASAIADQYPRLSIGAVFTTAAENPSGLFDSWVASLGAQLIAPLVDGGLREQEVARTVSIRRRRVAEYGEAVLTSFREVEDALALERHQVNRINSIKRQLEFANSTYAELRNQYLNGAADFIDVLIALRDQQDLERSVLSARLEQIQYRIALHRAIAGGFMPPVENPDHDTMNNNDALDGAPQ